VPGCDRQTADGQTDRRTARRRLLVQGSACIRSYADAIVAIVVVVVAAAAAAAAAAVTAVKLLI